MFSFLDFSIEHERTVRPRKFLIVGTVAVPGGATAEPERVVLDVAPDRAEPDELADFPEDLVGRLAIADVSGVEPVVGERRGDARHLHRMTAETPERARDAAAVEPEADADGDGEDAPIREDALDAPVRRDDMLAGHRVPAVYRHHYALDCPDEPHVSSFLLRRAGAPEADELQRLRVAE